MLNVLVVEDHLNPFRVLARWLDHFGMNIGPLFVCSFLLLFASVADGAGSYQRTRDGTTLVWNDSPEPGEYATWSGKRDKDGFATGSGRLTWYKVKATIITGSLIPNTRRDAVVIKRVSGEMVHGKLNGAVTSVDANGRRLSATFVDEGASPVNQPPQDRQSRPKEVTPAPTPAVTATPTAKRAPRPAPPKRARPTPERTPVAATPTRTPAPEQSPSPAAQETPAAVTQETATPAREQTATRTPEQQATPPDAPSAVVSIPTASDGSLRSLTAPPSALAKPPPSLDEHTVAALDTLYQKAVKANDVAIMDEILADDFVLVTDRGTTLTKAELIKEARDKRTIYEKQEEVKGTQKVRVWRDTAVVTSLLRIKGTRDQSPFDYKVWFSETYVRTPAGWRYVFGQASTPDAK